MQVCLSVYQRNIVNLWLIKYAKLKAYTAAYSCVHLPVHALDATNFHFTFSHMTVG